MQITRKRNGQTVLLVTFSQIFLLKFYFHLLLGDINILCTYNRCTIDIIEINILCTYNRCTYNRCTNISI